jgi:hypothetical protein
MSFFDKKEEVISIELTPYGRQLLSLGRLKPTYYAFFDDDVLYNTEAAGFTETSAEIKDRILNDTPYLKPTAVFQNLNDIILRTEEYLATEEIRYPSAINKLYYMQNPLGTCKETAVESAAFRTTFILNSSSAGTKFQINNSFPIEQIPQINVDYDYTITVMDQSTQANTDFVTNAPPEFRSKIFPDGTYFDIQDDNMILQLLEENGFSLSDSFEIEVFKVDEIDNERMTQLKFTPKQSNVVNDYIVDESEASAVPHEITPEFVEYYFNLFVDNEISINDLCKGVKSLSSQGLFIDLEVECPDVTDVGDPNIYRTRIKPSDLEVCDD